jgi:uncharacterized membrane protein YccC
MAIVNCSECGHRISDKAKSCPSCGVSYDNSSEEAAQFIVKLVVLGVIGLALFFVIIPTIIGVLKLIGLGIFFSKVLG